MKQGKRDAAIEKWRAIAHVVEGSDNDLAARAWFSVGYLAVDEDPKGSVLANDRAIRLKPDYAWAYNNRGVAKAALDLKDEARKDFEIALELAQKANDAKIVATSGAIASRSRCRRGLMSPSRSTDLSKETLTSNGVRVFGGCGDTAPISPQTRRGCTADPRKVSG